MLADEEEGYMLRKILLVSLVSMTTMVLTTLFQPLSLVQGLAQRDNTNACRTFVETGRTVCSRFLQYWQEHGGIGQFGYPISDPFTETSALNGKEYTVQYFERAVFESHPENKPPYDVLLSQLGTYRFQDKYPKGEPEVSKIENLPIYPGAQNVRVERSAVAALDETVINTITFDTRDPSQNVASFYKSVLATNGWLLVEDRSPAHLELVYISGTDNPAYGLKIDMQTLPRETSVKMSLNKTLPK